MNRIILIGNGFDLAHGLKTSYHDFIDWIVESKFEIFKNNKGVLNDEDLEIIYRDFWTYSDIEKFRNLLCNINSTDVKLGEAFDGESKEYEGFKNNFLEKLIINKYVNNWCDIETIFYDELNDLVDTKVVSDNDIEKFNLGFQRIINLLEEYLLIVIKNKNDTETHIEKRIADLLESNIKEIHLSIDFKNDLSYKYTEEGQEIYASGEVKVDKCLILDFNYTETILPYILERIPRKLKDNFEYINIHGALNDVDNPIIFGFGDELDENYSKIEKSRLKGALEYIKSINYLKTSNYRKFLEFLEIDDYQVFIWGHSCGVTDRTLLNHIFEHDHCAGIKPFYRKRENQSNNYIEIVSSIARNFTDKNKLRDRVVNFQFCEPLLF